MGVTPSVSCKIWSYGEADEVVSTGDSEHIAACAQ